MNNVKVKIANDLLAALHQCNLADVTDPDYLVNDLPTDANLQLGAFGHLAKALKALGYGMEYAHYCETGEVVEIIDISDYQGADDVRLVDAAMQVPDSQR